MVATTTTNKTAAAPITEATTTTSATPAAPIAEATNKAGDQLVSVVKQGQKVALDVAEALAKLTPSIPTPVLLKIEDAPELLPDFQALTTSGFDVAIELLTAQRDFAANLAAALTPAKAA
ncbi:hypothetical protein R1X32_01625 (plasmid) [Rhodococcus opacus]|uniref:hypothetical protein n=1 Tax=Rhodococcus opacus TaxID=37919 RepID=UPI00076A45F8|nr:hypothetical protein AXA44_46120 [Rhodococcus sp. SC4]WKN61267.1 hypothetical protein HJ581_0047655 [Rhodococcus opacus]